jgi:hypothetical protein
MGVSRVALIGWIVSFVTLFGGLALWQDMPLDGSSVLANGLFLLAALSCPLLWREKPLGITFSQRIFLAMAVLCSLPLLLFPRN